MLHATLVTSENELLQINDLNRKYLKQNLSAEERGKEGFVTWLYSIDLLKQMHDLAPSVIVKDDDTVVGYALVTLNEASAFHPDLKLMIDNLEPLFYQARPMFWYTFYCMGQVCIDKSYRGKGVFPMLYQKHKEAYSASYDLLITEISTSNFRSQKAHEKIGFKTIHSYHDQLDEWNVVVWNWQ